MSSGQQQLLPRWELAAPASRTELIQIMQQWRVSPPVAQVLLGREVTPQLLNPPLVLSPNQGLFEAAQQLIVAIRQQKRIRIHGDYDADGVSATATLITGLRRVERHLHGSAAKPEYIHGFIPHRLNEGYGIHPDKVSEHAKCADVLVTVDCGVSNLAEVGALIEAGLEVIVTDHHAPGEDFPDCLVVHPHLTEHYDPQEHNLTGAGVAYHLLWAVCQQLDLPEPRDLTALATLGTVADVAPLLGENRALVCAGLEEMRQTQLLGLRALMEENKLTKPTARDVAFVLAPRLNAAGRMGDADEALDLLTLQDAHQAKAKAHYLEVRNAERRKIQDAMFEEALTLVNPNDSALVLTHPSWHAGVMGIVASKLLDQFYKPVYIVAQGKGSVRSTPGISAVQGLRECSDLLHRFGGHFGAAGFSMDQGHFESFAERICEYVSRHPKPHPTIQLDAPLPVMGVTEDLLGEIDEFEPFGEGHQLPLWHVRESLTQTRLVGKNKNSLQFKIGQIKGIKYRETNETEGQRDLAAHMIRNEWRGRVNLELMGEALRPPEALCMCPDQQVRPLPRLDPKQAMLKLKAQAAAYAEGGVACFLQDNIPGLTLLSVTDQHPGRELILYQLPPEDILARWLKAGPVSFAFGPKTLTELEGNLTTYHLTPPTSNPLLDADGHEQSLDKAADAYRCWQWAHHYRVLDDSGWSHSVYAMLGVAPDAGL